MKKYNHWKIEGDEAVLYDKNNNKIDWLDLNLLIEGYLEEQDWKQE